LVGDLSKQWERDFANLDQFLRMAGFSVRQIAPGADIPDDTGALFVFGGAEELDEPALYRIDRYIQGGGRALFAVDGLAADLSQGMPAIRPFEDRGLLAMIASYGAVVRPALALDRAALTMRYQTADASGAPRLRITRYPLWIAAPGEGGNPSHPLTSRFSGIDLFWASPLELSPPSGVRGERLFTTTADGWLETKDFSANPEISYLLEAEAAETAGTHLLGAALSGVFPSYFAGKEKPAPDGAEALPDMPASPSESRVIVIGDSDIAGSFAQRRENFDFLTQIAVYLGNDEDIVSIRNRQPPAGRLDKITDEGERAAAMAFARFVNLGLVPAAVVAAGLILAWRRKRRSRYAG
jgi:ABC-type uncharacterized transport system involved in gliding motility auxiliary subunit